MRDSASVLPCSSEDLEKEFAPGNRGKVFLSKVIEVAAPAIALKKFERRAVVGERSIPPTGKLNVERIEVDVVEEMEEVRFVSDSD